jgi:hypothetical protein
MHMIFVAAASHQIQLIPCLIIGGLAQIAHHVGMDGSQTFSLKILVAFNQWQML